MGQSQQPQAYITIRDANTDQLGQNASQQITIYNPEFKINNQTVSTKVISMRTRSDPFKEHDDGRENDEDDEGYDPTREQEQLSVGVNEQEVADQRIPLKTKESI